MEIGRTSLLAFANNLTIPSGRGAVLMRDVAADFQVERFETLGPSLKALCEGTEPPIRRFWLEATKGASKDSDLAVCMLWAIIYSKRRISTQVGAKDSDQASEIRQIVDGLLFENPWLRSVVEIKNKMVVNPVTKSQIKIEASDETGAHGSRPDLILINELSHITKREFAETMMDNADKMPFGIVAIATNAGFTDTWQYRWRKNAIHSDRWWTQIINRPSPWLSADDIKDGEARNSPSRFRRLFWGEWSSGSGDAITEELLEAALQAGIEELPPPEPGRGTYSRFFFTAGLDIGIKHDHSGLVLLATDPETGRIQLACTRRWEPEQGEVDLIAVEEETSKICRAFGAQLFFDPYQAASIAQKLRRDGVQTREMPFTGKNLTTMATVLLQVFRERRVDLYDDSNLLLDLKRMSIVEKSYGHRIEVTKGEDQDIQTGHADVGTAFVIALPQAFELLSVAEDDVGELLTSGTDGDRDRLDDAEMADVPPILRDLLTEVRANARGRQDDD